MKLCPMSWQLINRKFGNMISVSEDLVDAIHAQWIRAVITGPGHAILSTIQPEAVPSDAVTLGNVLG